MSVLIIRTDAPEAQLYLYQGDLAIASRTWHAHRKLSDTIHEQIFSLLKQADKTLQDIDGIIVYQGPGSFTGLRIGVAAANALAFGLRVPIIGVSGDAWKADGIQQLEDATKTQYVQPIYGADAHTTTPKK